MKTKLTFAIVILALTGFTAAADERKPKPAVAEATAAKRTLSKLEKEHLKNLVAINEIVACVTLGTHSYTGASNLHAAKVTAECKGKLPTGHLFAHLGSDKGELPAAIRAPKNPLPKIAPGDYIVIVFGTEIINSLPGKKKKNYNYTIQRDGKKHCAWAKNSPEAVYIRQLCGK